MIKNETNSTMYVVMGYHSRDTVPIAIFVNEVDAKAFLNGRQIIGSVGWIETVDFYPEGSPKEL